MKLTGRTILVTGGSAGIGLAFALKFLELGNTVIVTGRRQEVLDAVKARHPKLHTIRGDVADPAQVAELAERVRNEFPKLDVLMNNAGIGVPRNLRESEVDLAGLMAETMRRIVEVHFPTLKKELLASALKSFYDVRGLPGLKKKPSTSELLDWLKLLVAEDIPLDALQSQDDKVAIPPLLGALLKNEQDVSLFEKLVFMQQRNR